MRYRIRANEYIVEALDRIGVPVAKPAGGHAVFIDARRWLPNIPPLQYPGQAIVCALYEIAGIRSCEIGTVMFGRQPDGGEREAALDLVRLAIPRRTYTQAHADYIIESFEELQGEHQRAKKGLGLFTSLDRCVISRANLKSSKSPFDVSSRLDDATREANTAPAWRKAVARPRFIRPGKPIQGGFQKSCPPLQLVGDNVRRLC